MIRVATTLLVFTTLGRLAFLSEGLPQADAQPPGGSPVNPPPASPEQTVKLRVASWNLESGDSNPEVLGREMAIKQGVDLWGLSEVNVRFLPILERGAEDGENADFAAINGTTGDEDRLVILYDRGEFLTLGERIELREVMVGNPGLRAPLAQRFRIRKTGQEFLFMVNHLKRGGAQNPERHEQAKRLNAWARGQTTPIIAVGDYNFDYDVRRGDEGPPHRDRGFDLLTANQVFTWVKPERLLKTHSDASVNSILDFVFISKPPANWSLKSVILDRERDAPATAFGYRDDSQESDHRPIDAVITIDTRGLRDTVAGSNATMRSDAARRNELVKQIEKLEAELKTLRDALKKTEGSEPSSPPPTKPRR